MLDTFREETSYKNNLIVISDRIDDCTGPEQREAFPRPETSANLLLRLARLLPVVDYMTCEKMAELILRSRDIFGKLGVDQAALDRIVTGTDWKIQDTPPDPNIFFGEAKFAKNTRPEVIVYRDTLAARIFFNGLRLRAQRSGMHHIFGHLVGYDSNPENASAYDEAVACRWEYRASLATELEWYEREVAALLVAFGQKYHKDVPYVGFTLSKEKLPAVHQPLVDFECLRTARKTLSIDPDIHPKKLTHLQRAEVAVLGLAYMQRRIVERLLVSDLA